MAFDSLFIEILTLALGAVGILANFALFLAIIFRSIVVFIILAIIIFHFPLIPLYHQATTRKDPMIEQYRMERGIGEEQALGIAQYADVFTVVLCSYSMNTSLIPFIASHQMRKKIIRKMDEMRGSLSIASKAQHDMLVKALNLQLGVSSFFMIGCVLFSFNLIILNVIPDFPETSPIIVPICNLQNVISAFSNLYVITPYRRAVTCQSSTTVSSVRSLNLSMPSNEANSVFSAPARL